MFSAKFGRKRIGANGWGVPDDPPDTVASIDPQDYEVVADLDDLLANDDDSVWSENESLSL